MKNYSIIAVDIQNEFATDGGKFYSPKPSIKFLKEKLFPFLKEKNIKVNEIISDYRQPRLGDRGDGCYPGTWGYESIIPRELIKSVWVKCMNSPIWVRDGIGDENKLPGLPYQDSKAFENWIKENIGEPSETIPVFIGLTIDCCVLSAAQEFNWHGYYPLMLREGVDHASGKIEDRDRILKDPVSNWAEVIDWDKLKSSLE